MGKERVETRCIEVEEILDTRKIRVPVTIRTAGKLAKFLEPRLGYQIRSLDLYQYEPGMKRKDFIFAEPDEVLLITPF